MPIGYRAHYPSIHSSVDFCLSPFWRLSTEHICNVSTSNGCCQKLLRLVFPTNFMPESLRHLSVCSHRAVNFTVSSRHAVDLRLNLLTTSCGLRFDDECVSPLTSVEYHLAMSFMAQKQLPDNESDRLHVNYSNNTTLPDEYIHSYWCPQTSSEHHATVTMHIIQASNRMVLLSLSGLT
jgi:hypothetical protein